MRGNGGTPSSSSPSAIAADEVGRFDGLLFCGSAETGER
jgi:hypothetical protein